MLELLSTTRLCKYPTPSLTIYRLIFSGSKGVLRFNTELQRAQNPQLNIAVKMCEDIKKKGNHITAILSVSDLL